MLIMATYFKMEGWNAVKNFLAYLLLCVSAFYVFGLLIIAGVIAASFLLTAHFVYKSVLLHIPKLQR